MLMSSRAAFEAVGLGAVSHIEAAPVAAGMEHQLEILPLTLALHNPLAVEPMVTEERRPRRGWESSGTYS